MQLCKYSRPIASNELHTVLDNPSRILNETIDGEVDFSAFMTRLEELIVKLESGAMKSRTSLDAELVAPLHEAMSGVSRRVACDMLMWQWLCIGPMRRFVTYRWVRGGRGQEGELSASKAGRFLGSPTLNGMSRNALARLYWCGQQLHTESEGYELARVVISNQDFYQAIFERRLGNYKPVARACVRVLREDSEEVRRDVLRLLNYELSTTVLEVTTESECEQLVTQLKERVVDSAS